MNGVENIKPEFKLVNHEQTGFWWCNGCMKVTQLKDRHASILRCIRCDSIKIKWCLESIKVVPKEPSLDFSI